MPQFSIGQVVERLKAEFPALSPSKIRFFEERELVVPQRLANGYRKFSLADIERLRYVLILQRDKFLPLEEIRKMLVKMDREVRAGRSRTEVVKPANARIVSRDGHLVEEQYQEGLITTAQLLDLSGLALEELEELVKLGIIHPDLNGRFPARAHNIVKLVVVLKENGVDPSRIKFLKTSAERVADLANLLYNPKAQQLSGVEKERRHAQKQEFAQANMELFKQFLRVSLD